MEIRRRIIGFLCCAAILCVLIPHMALAEDEGSGTASLSGGDPVPGQILKEIDALDFTADLSDYVPDLERDGYSWTGNDTDGYVLTLKNVKIKGETDIDGGTWALKLPRNHATITIRTEGEQRSVLDGNIFFTAPSQGAYHLIFTDHARLYVNGGIEAGINGEQVTVQNGADIEFEQRVSIGGSGNQDSTLKVTTGGKLTIKGTNDQDIGFTVTDLEVTDGGVLVTGCPIGVIAHIELGSDAIMEMKALPLLWDAGGNETALELIKNYFPDGYHTGYGTINGMTFFTVLDRDGNVASELTLLGPASRPEEQPTVESTESPATSSLPDSTGSSEESSSGDQNPSKPSAEEGSSDFSESEEPSDLSESEESSGSMENRDPSGGDDPSESTTAGQTQTESSGKEYTSGSSGNNHTDGGNAGSGQKPAGNHGNGTNATVTSTQEAAADPANQNSQSVALRDQSPNTGDQETVMLWSICAVTCVVVGSLTYRWRRRVAHGETR